MENREKVETYESLVNQLSELCGIVNEYYDIFGNKHSVTTKTKKAILKAMGLNIESSESLKQEIDLRRWGPWRRFIEPVYVVSVQNQPLSIPVYLPVTEEAEAKLILTWSIADEKGRREEFTVSGSSLVIVDQQRINGRRYIKIDIRDNKTRDIGYYKLYVTCINLSHGLAGEKNILEKTARVIITPDTCCIPPELENRKTWGLSVNLYSIRSVRNWGIGDLTDLRSIVRWIAGMKGGFVGINPLHAIPNTKPYGISPYFPISRLYRNFIYLDIEGIPEVEESVEALAIIKSKEFLSEMDELRRSDYVDYEKVSLLKRKILEKAFDYFYENHLGKNTGRSSRFRKYLSEEGEPLESFALYMAIMDQMQASEKVYSWQQWPEEYKDRTGVKVQAFKETHKKEILFHQYIQWLMDEQLREIAGESGKLGMPMGLYNDLAIGSNSGGSDIWNFHETVACNVDVGAPPDDFNIKGQNWGFPPVIPEKLKETGYDFFIQTIRKNMKHSGALRIDHALGLFRLFWIPSGMSPRDGAYIEYPAEDLLRIIALESVRNRTIVIAEDLGTIGENVREMLKRFQMLSYRLFYFERNYPDPSFLSPEKFPDMALCSVTTHDLPTLYGYWQGQDIKTRRDLGMYYDDTLLQRQAEERERDKALILSALKSQGILQEDFPADPSVIPQMNPYLCCAIYEYLARTTCKLVIISLDDIIGTLNQQNLPGTIDTHPNWVQKIPMKLEDIFSDKRFIELSEMLRKYRGV